MPRSSKVEECLNVDPICIVSPAEVLERLVHVVAGEVMTKTGLNLHKRRRLICRNEVNLLAGETTILRVDTVAAGRTRHLVDLVKEVARGSQPEGIVGQGHGKALKRSDACFEIGIDQVLPREKIHRAIELVVGGVEVDESIVFLVRRVAIARGKVEAQGQAWLEIRLGERVAALDMSSVSLVVQSLPIDYSGRAGCVFKIAKLEGKFAVEVPPASCPGRV